MPALETVYETMGDYVSFRQPEPQGGLQPGEMILVMGYTVGCPNCGLTKHYEESQERGVWRCYKCNRSGAKRR